MRTRLTVTISTRSCLLNSFHRTPTHIVLFSRNFSSVCARISGALPSSISRSRSSIALRRAKKKHSVAISNGADWYGVSKAPGTDEKRMSQKRRPNIVETMLPSEWKLTIAVSSNTQDGDGDIPFEAIKFKMVKHQGLNIDIFPRLSDPNRLSCPSFLKARLENNEFDMTKMLVS